MGYTMVSFVECLMASGVKDPYEFYEYVHYSKVGNAVGSGVGGLGSLREMFVETKFGDAPKVQGDILQETFINTTAAWLNMLFLSSCGPIKTPVGACATAAESVSIGYDAIRLGQAKIMVVGAYDDLTEESNVEFANMKATSNSDLEAAKGRSPQEACRPMSTSRAGFMEAHGAGILVLMSGDLALEMGMPIYGILAMAHTATNTIGRSVPAPGKGVLSAVSEDSKAVARSPLLDLAYRKRQLDMEINSLNAWKASEVVGKTGEDLSFIDEEHTRMMGDVRRRWGTEWVNGHLAISPLRGSLAVWGLTADDIALVSCHGTSTKLNDMNESSILNEEMNVLGRTKGNPAYVVTQKWLTGHPKGPAACWQLGGAMQAMLSSTVPGNRNLDDVDVGLQKFDNLLQTNRTLKLQKYFEAVSVTSFGFGQAGGQVIIVHPDRLLATLSEEEFTSYTNKRDARWSDAFKLRQDVFGGKLNMVRVKDDAPYPEAPPAIVDRTSRYAAKV